jgi:predicted porin
MNLNDGTLSSTNGNPNRFWSRQAYLELESKTYGALRVGRQEGPTYTFFPRFDPMLMPSMDAWGVLTTLGAPAPGRGSGTGVSSGFLINPTGRTENTVGYISPRLSGLQAKLSYSLNEGSQTQPRILESYAEYESGPLVLGVLFVNASSTSGSGATRPTKSVSETAIGASYQFGPVNPYVSFIRRNLTDPTIGADGNVLNNNSETVKLIGAVIPVSGRSSLRATYGRYSSGSAGRDATNYGVAYTYDLSRSFSLMAAVTRLTQGGAATWPIFQSPRPTAGSPVTGTIIGANYRF